MLQSHSQQTFFFQRFLLFVEFFYSSIITSQFLSQAEKEIVKQYCYVIYFSLVHAKQYLTVDHYFYQTNAELLS